MDLLYGPEGHVSFLRFNIEMAEGETDEDIVMGVVEILDVYTDKEHYTDCHDWSRTSVELGFRGALREVRGASGSEELHRIPAGKVVAPKAGVVKVRPTNDVADIVKAEAKKKRAV